MKLGGGAGGDAACVLYQREQAGRSNWGAVLELCKNKLMNDNRSLIEGTEVIPSTDSDGLLRVVMVMGAERLWRPPDPGWSRIIVYTRHRQHLDGFTRMNIYKRSVCR